MLLGYSFLIDRFSNFIHFEFVSSRDISRFDKTNHPKKQTVIPCTLFFTFFKG